MSEVTNYRFSIIPGWIVTDRRLKGKDLQVICLLGRHTNREDGWCRRSQVKMAKELECSRSTVQASLDRLVEIGAVERRIVMSPDGRDSAHRYRVIYDREVDSVANSAWHEEDRENDFPENADPEAAPPADIPAPPAGPESAPPAGPESAPPAGPESAPINDSHLTPLPNETSGGADAEGRKEDRTFDRKKIEDAFWRWQKGWIGKGSLTFALNAWYALSPEERDECIRLTPAYVAGKSASELGPPAPFLKNREWRNAPEVAAATQQQSHGVAKAFGKLWMGTRFAALDQPPTGLIHLTAFDERRLASGVISRDELLREKRRDHGWPLVKEMADFARRREQFVTSLELLPHVSGFTPVHRDSETFSAWHRLHERRGWPFFEASPEWVYFPPASNDAVDLDAAVDAALTGFLVSVKEGLKDDAA